MSQGTDMQWSLRQCLPSGSFGEEADRTKHHIGYRVQLLSWTSKCIGLHWPCPLTVVSTRLLIHPASSTVLGSSGPTTVLCGSVIFIPLSQMRKLRFREDWQRSRTGIFHSRPSCLIIPCSDDYNNVSQTSAILSDFYCNCASLHYLLHILH